jgi:hypothetical protein
LSSRAPRLLSFLVLVVALGLATGLVGPAESDACDEPCPGEGPGGECPPDCIFCACCPSVRPMIVPEGGPAPDLEPVAALMPARSAMPLPPEPREILHIPRSLLA